MALPTAEGEPQCRLLEHLVRETLAGRAERLKGFNIAIDVFGRDETFDSQRDPIVRIEARRLRDDLERYYLSGKPTSALRISVPKGGYVPEFTPLETRERTDKPARTIAPTQYRVWRDLRVVLTALAIASASLVAWWALRTPLQSEQARIGVPRVAVMEFENLTGDSAETYFARDWDQKSATSNAPRSTPSRTRPPE